MGTHVQSDTRAGEVASLSRETLNNSPHLVGGRAPPGGAVRENPTPMIIGPRGIQLYYKPYIRKVDYRAARAFFDRAIFSLDPNYAAPMRGEALHLESFIWLTLASDGREMERAMGIEPTGPGHSGSNTSSFAHSDSPSAMGVQILRNVGPGRAT